MRTLLSLIMWLYFLPGTVLGIVLFVMRMLESAMSNPEPMALANAAGMNALEGLLRALYWVPSAYDKIILNGVPPMAWAFS